VERLYGDVRDISEQIRSEMNGLALAIWNHAELALEEKKSSLALQHYLAQEGFIIETGIGGLATAFTASWGAGGPTIGILAEFDALPGLSQKAGLTRQEAVVEQAPGHGCGHNLFGVASAGSAIIAKRLMERNHLPGRIILFGCPAEETVEGKVYMSHSGLFARCDVCLDWHPSSDNEVSLSTSNALNNFQVEFTGKTAHAAGDPWNGRSALDGIELLDVGINFLREHVPPTVRIHYVISDGGLAPNVVPGYAKAWYYVRGKDRKEVDGVYSRVLKIAEGAALMSETQVKVTMITGVYNYLKNRQLAKVLFRNLTALGATEFSEADQRWARAMQKELEKAEDGLSTRIKPLAEADGYSGGGSSDAADVSWQTPTASLQIACWPKNTPGHSWAVTSSSGHDVGLKGMQKASQVLAATVLDLFTDQRSIKKARQEFLEQTKDFTYKSAIPKDQSPRAAGRRGCTSLQ